MEYLERNYTISLLEKDGIQSVVVDKHKNTSCYSNLVNEGYTVLICWTGSSYKRYLKRLAEEELRALKNNMNLYDELLQNSVVTTNGIFDTLFYTIEQQKERVASIYNAIKNNSIKFNDSLAETCYKERKENFSVSVSYKKRGK